jgi:hypothetical protein
MRTVLNPVIPVVIQGAMTVKSARGEEYHPSIHIDS